MLHDIAPLTAQTPFRTLLARVSLRLGLPDIGDPFPDVFGMASSKKLRLLNVVARHLPSDGSECYFEVGTFQGKSLVAAASGNPSATFVACDNFTLFDDPQNPKNYNTLLTNLATHGLKRSVRFYNEDFKETIVAWRERDLPPVGIYFYDGAHDEESQYQGVRLVEPLLANSALVVIDDWRFAADSQSYAEAGTRRAVSGSANRWKIEHVLPAKFNGDKALWWNGVGVLSFERL